ncbi:MAG: hypothetical protein IPM13_02775 [Phycisphaerales bacterium]|nr:hypothetical protein [Phycisphaerales bacterium]
MPAPKSIRRCLVSVYDKRGVVEFARALHDEFGIEIISTGGTARALRDAGVPVTLIEDITGFPELLDGRVKTLHPAIHAGILADRDNPEHMRQLAARGIKPIDMVVVSLYPFEETVADPDCTFEQAVEMIDIGGVTLLRAAAKNHKHVLVVSSADDCDALLRIWRQPGDGAECSAAGFFRDSAKRTLRRTARYDAAIAAWLSAAGGTWPHYATIWALDWGPMRYGENPHQSSRLYDLRADRACNLVFAGSQDGVDEQTRMSYNNYLDADAALGLCAELARARSALRGLIARPVEHPLMAGATRRAGDPHVRGEPCTCVFIKHTNACGAAVHGDPVEAYRRAYLGDPNAAMGGILATDFDVDAGFAAVVMETYTRFGKPLKDAGAAHAPGAFFLEVWIAPRFTDDAVAIIRGTYDAATAKPEPGEPTPRELLARPGGVPRKDWGQRVRLLAVGDMATEPDADALLYRSIAGGLLVQSPDRPGLNEDDWKVVTQRPPTPQEMDDLRLAWLVCKHTKSNAITVCRGGMLIGNGAGQMSRVMSCRIATWLARENGHSGTGHREQGTGNRAGTGGHQAVGERGESSVADPEEKEANSGPVSTVATPVAASDAFFPFPDGPRILIEAGITALIQPGGGKRDQETIDLCNQHGVAMIFTGTRHFRH